MRSHGDRMSVVARHSLAAQFDGDKPVVLKGVVTKDDWRNPHIWVYLDVRGADARSRNGSAKAARRMRSRVKNGAAII